LQVKPICRRLKLSQSVRVLFDYFIDICVENLNIKIQGLCEKSFINYVVYFNNIVYNNVSIATNIIS